MVLEGETISEEDEKNEAPTVAGLSEENIQPLEEDIGFDCNPMKLQKRCSFEERFKQLEVYKARKHGHCNVKQTSGNNKSLGRWCSHVRSLDLIILYKTN